MEDFSLAKLVSVRERDREVLLFLRGVPFTLAEDVRFVGFTLEPKRICSENTDVHKSDTTKKILDKTKISIPLGNLIAL